ncbi:hypothetical protein C0995_004173 [Termitomyces sp. Mi166|nr:hypothetical protein C0995_004173 [Termitomyces sp. Mi166\
MDKIVKWTAGSSYSGPPLSQAELYDLRCELKINPFLGMMKDFSLVPGQTNGFTGEAHTLPFGSRRHEPATFPCVTQLIVITKEAPWCTVVKNESGVTVGDVVVKIYSECALALNILIPFQMSYDDNWNSYSTPMGDWELMTLPRRVQEHIHLCSAMRTGLPRSQLKRYDWLQHHTMFNGLRKDRDFAQERLGYDASNVFIMDLCM